MKHRALWMSVVAGTIGWANVCLAGPGSDIVACPQLDQTVCPALQAALKAPAEATKELTEMLADADTSSGRLVRAATAIGLLVGDKAGPLLKNATLRLKPKHPARGPLVAAAVRHGAKGLTDELMTMLNGASPQSQILAAGALTAAEHKQAAPRLRALLTEGKPHVQAAAARALVVLGGPADVPDLLALASSHEAFTPARMNALKALAKHAPRPALSIAVRLVDHPSRSVGRCALEVIERAPMRWTRPAIRFALQTPGLRGRAALAAVKLKDLGREVLVAALAVDLTASERSWVLHALGQLRPLGAGTALMKRLPQLSPSAQIEVLKSLPALKDQTVVRELVKMLATTKRPVANYIVYALENVTGQRLGDNLDAWRSYAGLDKPQAPKGAQPTPDMEK